MRAALVSLRQVGTKPGPARELVPLLGIALAKLFLFDLAQLSSLARVGSFLSVGLVLLAASFVVQRLARPVRSS